MFQIANMAKVKKSQIMKVGVLLKKLKLKAKKVEVNVLALRLSVKQISDLPTQRQTRQVIGKKAVQDCVVGHKVSKSSRREFVNQKSKSKNKFAPKPSLKSEVKSKNEASESSKLGLTVVPVMAWDGAIQIKDCRSKGKVTRLRNCLRWNGSFQPCDNYGLGSQKSMQEDSEDSPKKKVPIWAEERQLRIAIIAQMDVDIDQDFAACDPPDLSGMFPRTASRRKDIWNSPTRSQPTCATPQPPLSDSPPPPASHFTSWQEDEDISFHQIPRDKIDNQHRSGEHKHHARIVLFNVDSVSLNGTRC